MDKNALLELGLCPHDNSCVGCNGMELSASRFFSAELEFDDIAEICLTTLTKNGMHHGGNIGFNLAASGDAVVQI